VESHSSAVLISLYRKRANATTAARCFSTWLGFTIGLIGSGPSNLLHCARATRWWILAVERDSISRSYRNE
jgi:hypothetical protein